MLETLRIQNFKSWRDTGTIQFGALTGFFGTNSSGKTSILQFLLMLKQTVESSDRAQVLNLGDEKTYVELGTVPDVIHNHQFPDKISFEVKYCSKWPLFVRREYEIPKGKSGFSVINEPYNGSIKLSAVIQQNKNSTVVERFDYTLNEIIAGMHLRNGFEPERMMHYQLIYQNINLLIEKEELSKLGIPSLSKFYLFPSKLLYAVHGFDFLNELSATFEQEFENIFYLGPLREYPKRRYSWGGGKVQGVGNRGENVIAALLSSRQEGITIVASDGQPERSLEEHIAYWLHRLGVIESFRLQTIVANLYEVRVKRTAESAEVFLTDVGFGVSQLLPVLVLLFYVPEGSTIILEQPEIHLHPAVQAGLADVILDAIKRRNVQIILESHSEHLLHRLQTRLAEEVITPDKVKLYFTKFEKAASEIEELKLDAYGNILNWPKNFFGDQFGEAAARMEEELKRRQAAGEK